jgi:copper chaperone NosL
MKGKILVGFFLIAFLMTGFSALAQTADDIKKHPNCKFCGMDREKFNFSRMLNVYSDDSEFGSCSLHCAALDLALNMGKSPKAILVADFNTK